MEDRVHGGRRVRRGTYRLRPGLEDLEPRKLMSITPVIASGRHVPISSILLHAEEGAGGSAGGGGVTGMEGSANGFPNGGNSLSPLLGQGQPTPHELARERFHAYFSGPITVSPGRFSDQAKIIYFRGLGGSTQFRHGDYQMAIVIPTDPNAQPFGEAVLEDKNNNSSGIIGLPLTAVPNAVDRLGRPTQLTFTQDPNIYSGIDFVNSSTGTLNITYSKGSATAIFNGKVYTSGLTSPIKNSDLYSRGGRISPRSGR
jgi:hypothetical protein